MSPPFCTKVFFFGLIITFVFGFMVTSLIMDMFHSKYRDSFQLIRPPKPISETSNRCENCQSTNAPPQVTKKVDQCKGCKQILAIAAKFYAEPWKRQDKNQQEFTSRLSSKCNGSEEAIVTQANTPVHSLIWFNGEAKSKVNVTPDLFDSFPKELHLTSKKLDSCSVVGNGGILIDSKCGKQIDSAQFVIRCNLPPVEGLEVHVGNKTDLVTANPSIFHSKFGSLKNNNKTYQFLEMLHHFSTSYLLIPAFSFRYNTAISLLAARRIKDRKRLIKPIFFNPSYLKNLAGFWRSVGLREPRLSTGFTMVSLALELCSRVDLYGFWPFGIHPERLSPLTNHYYDNVPPRKGFHYMPSEFKQLLQLHSRGVLRIHLGDCRPRDD